MDPADADTSYLNRLTHSPLLTAEEEIWLTRAAQQGDQTARQRLVESNMRLVLSIARSYRSHAIPLEDLIQEGAIGLIRAVERFDPDKGFRFSTYATHWVRQAIGRALDNTSKSIRLPAHVSQLLRKIERTRVRLARELGADPTPEALAEALEISVEKLAWVTRVPQDVDSLDQTVGESDALTLASKMADPNAEDPEGALLDREENAALMQAIRELSEREQMVLEKRLATDDRDKTAVREELSKQLDLSRERVRQIEIQAIKKLRILAQRRKYRESLGP